jgi:hypothetical protein
MLCICASPNLLGTKGYVVVVVVVVVVFVPPNDGDMLVLYAI